MLPVKVSAFDALDVPRVVMRIVSVVPEHVVQALVPALGMPEDDRSIDRDP